jgi:phosphatidylserine synthase 2
MSSLKTTKAFGYHQSIFWKFILCISIIYQIYLFRLLGKTKTDARDLRYLDPSLGRRLPERSYAENCSLNNEVIKNQMDAFVISHTLGSFVKGLLFRDYWICWILSIAFEILEYSLAHQLPNFAECWWDHWVLDVILCNGIGIYIGIKTIEYLQWEKYHWRDIKPVSHTKRNISWNPLDWLPKSGFRHYIGVLLSISFVLQCELNVFYLKYLLWVPPEHYLVSVRIFIFSLICAPGISEVYYYNTDPKQNKLGLHSFFMVLNLCTETIICLKFSQGEFPNPAPLSVKIFWIVLTTFLTLYPIITFGINKRFPIDRRKE